ncbi:MAG: tetratricopeptide repeat protein, partial [Chloroflexi bacterium]
MNARLEKLYQEVKSALKAKNYDHAAELLKQILAIDENYKDASRLLAQTVKLRRRHWYNHPALWGIFSVLFVVGSGIFLLPKIQSLYSSQAFSPTLSVPTATLLQTSPPATVSVSPSLLPTPTAVPLVWKRIAVGQEFPRDTVSAFATDKNDPDIIYASLQNAGVYKSIDGGLSWRPAHQGLSNTQVESLFIDF